jgi:hypothetical protein
MPIYLSSQFDLRAQLPLRKWEKVETLAERDLIPNISRYDGFTTYVAEDTTNYQLQGGITNSDWVASSSSTDWDDITNTPTTESGYGITDGFTSWDKDYSDLINKPTIPTYSAGNGLGLSGSTFSLDTPSTLTSTTTNAVTSDSHTHAITGSLGLIGNGSAQYQIPVTGSTPFTPTWATVLNLVGANGLNSLSYSAASFVKMTGANTFSLDTNTYSLSNHNHDSVYASKMHNFIDTTNHPVSGLTTGHFLKATGATTYGFAAHGLTYTDVGAAAASHTHGGIYEPVLGNPAVNGYVLSSTTSGVRSWIEMSGGSSQWTDTTGGIYYTTGNVGIGTTTPESSLHLMKSVDGGDGARMILANNNYPSGNTASATGVSFSFGITTRSAKINAYTSASGYGYIGRIGIGMMGTNDVYNEGLSIINNGNVGIGLIDPDEKLEVYGSIKISNASIPTGIVALKPSYFGYSNTYKALVIGDTSGSSTISMGYDPVGNANGSFAGDGREILFRNGVQFVTPNAANTSFNLTNLVLKDGNVGIGTTAPKKKLEVAGDIMAGTNNTIGWRYSAGNDNYYSYLTANGASYLNIVGGLFTTDGTTEAIRLTSYSGTVSMLNNGNVGIGTTTPEYALDVNGNINSTGLRLVRSSSSLKLPVMNFGDTLGGAVTDNLSIGNVGGGAVIFFTNGTERMRIASDGKVGIGTTAPSYTLDVNGTCRIGTLGGLIYGTSGALSGIANGTTGQVLKMGASAPEWGAGGSVSFGTDNQIPVMNSGGTDFEYSKYLTWDGKRLLLDYHTQIFIGKNAGYANSNTTNTGNIFIGEDAGFSNTTGAGSNLFIGYKAGRNNSTGGANTIIGGNAGINNTGSNNTFIGGGCGLENTGSNNTFLGLFSGYTGDGSSNVFIGTYAGYYETGSNKLFIDNRSRTNEATSRTASLIYGEFNDTPASQLLRVNGVLDHSLVPNKPKIYSQATEPNIPNDTMAFWKDTDDSKYYLILDIGGTQKKVELT